MAQVNRRFFSKNEELATRAYADSAFTAARAYTDTKVSEANTYAESLRDEAMAYTDDLAEEIMTQANFIKYYDSMPAPEAELENQIVQYTGPSDGEYVIGHTYQCVYDSNNDYYYWQDLSIGEGNILPTPSEQNVGQIIQYTGEDSGELKQGHFYICKKEEISGIINYYWEEINTTDIDLNNYLAKDNTTSYTPTADYNPATKKYVDDSAAKPYTNLTKIKDYLYEVYYSDLDYKYALEHYEDFGSNDFGACTAVRKGNFYGRNYDWTYNNQAEFIIRTARENGHFASISMSAGPTELTEEKALDENYTKYYKMVPFRALDGINEYGVIANTNVVPVDGEPSNPTTPLVEERLVINARMIVRYILDNFKSAKEAVEYIRDYVSIYQSADLLEHNYELHTMVADKDKTYLLEVIEDELVITDMTAGSNSTLDGKTYMTNFALSNITFTNNTIYTPADVADGHLPTVENGIHPHGAGLERYKLIQNSIDSITNKAGMRTLMNNLMYTRMYPSCTLEGGTANPAWYSELVGEIEGTDYTVDTPAADFVPILNAADGFYQERTRTDGKTWQTAHSAVYDIENKTLSLITQEDLDDELEYSLEIVATKEYVETNYNKAVYLDFKGIYTAKNSAIPTDSRDYINITDSSIISKLKIIRDNYFNNTPIDVTADVMYWRNSAANIAYCVCNGEYILYGTNGVPNKDRVYLYFYYDGKSDGGTSVPYWYGYDPVALLIKLEKGSDSFAYCITKLSFAKIMRSSDMGSYARSADVITKTNTSAYTPTSNYHPATKKYVDDSIAAIPTSEGVWEAGTGSYSVQQKGTDSVALGDSSVAEGYMTHAGTVDTVEDWAEGKGAHSEGGNTTARGNYSHAEGNSTVTNNPYEHAEGAFNISHFDEAIYPLAGNTIHSIGIGSNLSNAKNAFEVMQNGDAYLIGVGDYDGTNPGDATSLQETISSVDDATKLKTITISQSQIVSITPLIVTATAEQQAIIEDTNVTRLCINASALGQPAYSMVRKITDNDEYTNFYTNMDTYSRTTGEMHTYVDAIVHYEKSNHTLMFIQGEIASKSYVDEQIGNINEVLSHLVTIPEEEQAAEDLSNLVDLPDEETE